MTYAPVKPNSRRPGKGDWTIVYVGWSVGIALILAVVLAAALTVQ